jgi:Flp pilus assembly CpaF family ATPase
MTKRGLVIFVGATGTGKSTSLAAMIGYRNQNSTGHIITIEDPDRVHPPAPPAASSPSARWAWIPSPSRSR